MKIIDIFPKWNETDKLCENCGKVEKPQRGICRQNMKRLITPRFDMNEIVFTIIIIMVIVLAFAYKNETQQCRDWLMPMFADNGENCLIECNNRCGLIEENENFGLNETQIKEMQDIMKKLNPATENYE